MKMTHKVSEPIVPMRKNSQWGAVLVGPIWIVLAKNRKLRSDSSAQVGHRINRGKKSTHRRQRAADASANDPSRVQAAALGQDSRSGPAMALRRPGRCVSFIRPQPRLNPVYNSRLFRSRDCYSSVKPWTRQALNPDAPAVWASVARPTMRPGDRPPSLTCATTSPWSRRFEELCLPLGAVAVHPLDSVPR